MSDPVSALPVESVQLGPHTVEIQGDCTLVRLRGPFVLDEMKKWCSLADQVIAAHRVLFTISDFSAGGWFPADSRHYASHWPNVVHIRGTAIFGASFAVNVMVSMTARVTALVQKHAIPTVAVKTESEARAWIAAQRQKSKSERG